MKLLAIETCFKKTSVCCYINGEMFEKVENEQRKHAEALPNMVEVFFKEHNISTQKLDGILVNHGPGAFTGMRIGIAFAKGLATPFEIPLYGVSTLECFAFNECAVAVQALKNNVYFQEFNSDAQPIGEISYTPVSEITAIKNLITVGVNIKGETEHFPQTPIASDLIKRFLFKKPPLFQEPLYVRPVNAVIPPNMKKITCK